METVIDATLPTDQFVLEETIEVVSDVEFEFARLAIHSSDCTVPFLWASTNQPEQLDAALQNDSSTERVHCLSREDGQCLYSIDWTKRAARRIDRLVEADGSVLAVRGTSDHWTVQTLFTDRETASETFQTWCDEGVTPSLSCIGSISRGDETSMGLSATQYSTIARAFQTGYYDIPRGTTLAELAADLDVSHQALSERLRRGHAHLVERLLSESATGAKQQPLATHR